MRSEDGASIPTLQKSSTAVFVSPSSVARRYRAVAAPTGDAAFRVAVLGDVHGEWRDREFETLRAAAAPDLLLAVGDFANEDPHVVERVAGAARRFPGPAHLVLGNHDAWRSSRTGAASPRLRRIVSSVQGLDVGFRRVEAPSATGVFSVVGGRPLSWGGGAKATTPASWALLRELYGVGDAAESRDVLTDALLGALGPAIVVFRRRGHRTAFKARVLCVQRVERACVP